jgi:tRNA pseudouridine55 synthase
VATRGGILLLDKPLGLSSNAALQRVRRAYGRMKAGHTGSLDPLASGMLPICLGEATKLAGELLAGHKCYRFTVQLGESRTTGDCEGEVSARLPVPAALEQAAVQAALAGLTGPQLQIPPMYSALKHQGQPLYKLARQGVEVERRPRQVLIESLELLQMQPTALELRCRCGSGTYIRTLGESIAAALGTCGHLSALRREYVEPFAGQTMVQLADLEEGRLPAALIPADQGVPQLPACHLDAGQTLRLQRGQLVVLSKAGLQGGAIASDPATQLVRLYDASGGFFGLGEWQVPDSLRAKRLYASSCSA